MVLRIRIFKVVKTSLKRSTSPSVKSTMTSLSTLVLGLRIRDLMP